MLVGIVVGIGIFKTPPLIAANAGSEATFVALWLVGGVLTVIGALCYAELGAARPSAGGEYHFLHEAYGRFLSFLFAWGRMTVMQTGAIAAVAFAYGEYAAAILPLGPLGVALHAAVAVIVLAALQLIGTQTSGRLQLILTVSTVLLIILVAASGFLVGPPPADAAPAEQESGGAAGLALVFILLTYGGWNEAAYLSGEIRDVRRNMLRVLLLGAGTVTILYLLINVSLIMSLGLDGLRQEELVTEPVERLFGAPGGIAVAVIVCVAALSTLNGTMFTGARSMFALGRDFAPLKTMAARNRKTGAPSAAIVAQAAIALCLIAFGAGARDGFAAMVEYTAPVFWTFMFLIGASLFVFRWRDPGGYRPYRVPLYPVTPLVFCGTALYLVHASIAYTGVGALFGLAILAVGIPVYILGRQSYAPHIPSAGQPRA
jgi:amino acid transporter